MPGPRGTLQGQPTRAQQHHHRFPTVKHGGGGGTNKRLAERSPEKAQKRAALGNITNVNLVEKIKIPDDPIKPNFKAGRKTTVTVIKRGDVVGGRLQKAVRLPPLSSAAGSDVKEQQVDDVSNKTDHTEYIILSSQDSNENSSQESCNASSHKQGSQPQPQADDTETFEDASDTIPTSKPDDDVGRKMARLEVDDSVEGVESSSKLSAVGSHSPQLPDGVVDIDRVYYTTPENVPTYATDVFNYLRKRETLFLACTTPAPHLSSQQVRRVFKKRENIVKWFTQVQEEFGLNHETMYHGIKLFDLYLGKVLSGKAPAAHCGKDVSKPAKVPEKTAEFALIAGTCFFMACKCDDQLCPSLDHFVEALENMCSREELIMMERKILVTLHFDINVPHAYEFLRRYGKCIQLDMPSITLARYILESVNMNHSLLSLLDSQRAGAALYLSLNMLEHEHRHWSPQLQYYSGYTAGELVSAAQTMNDTLRHHLSLRDSNDNINPILQKYMHPVFFKVADIPLIDNEELSVTATVPGSSS